MTELVYHSLMLNSGHRSNLILWCRNSKFRALQTAAAIAAEDAGYEPVYSPITYY
jgi:hypothetical protein